LIDYIEERTLEASKIMLKGGLTIREAAKEIGISKSTLHRDITEKLKNIDNNTWKQVRNLLDHHLKVRAIRGGLASQKKRR